ncbi:signal peptidase I [Rhodococcus erythropolis]
MNEHGKAAHPVLRCIRETLLTVGAVLGFLCIVSAGAALIFGITPLVVRSGSMAPEMPTGSLALARTVAANDLRVSDIVSVTRSDGARLTHRVHDIGAGTQTATVLTLKGDANTDPDSEPIVVSEVDRVFLTIPQAGYVLIWTSTPTALVLVGLCVGGLIFTARRPRRPSPHPVTTLLTAVAVAASATAIAAGASHTADTAAALADTAVAQADVTAGTLTPPTNYSCQSFGDVGYLELSWDRIPDLTHYQLVVRNTSGVAQPAKPLITNPTSGARVTFRVERYFLTNSLAVGSRWSVELRSVRNNFVSSSFVRRVLVHDGAFGPRCALDQSWDTAFLAQTAQEAAPTATSTQTPATTGPSNTSTSGTSTPNTPVTSRSETSQPEPTPPTPTETTPTSSPASTTTDASPTPDSVTEKFASATNPLTSPSGKYRAHVVDGSNVITDATGQTLYTAPAADSPTYGYGAIWSTYSDELWILSENPEIIRVTLNPDGTFSGNILPAQHAPPEIAALLRP